MYFFSIQTLHKYYVEDQPKNYNCQVTCVSRSQFELLARAFIFMGCQ